MHTYTQKHDCSQGIVRGGEDEGERGEGKRMMGEQCQNTRYLCVKGAPANSLKAVEK
jgi:hypothetical protein